MLRSICDDTYGQELHDTERFLEVFDKHVTHDSGSNNSSSEPVTLPQQFLLPSRPQCVNSVGIY